MKPDDPRHGTEAGYEQHGRDDEPACTACHQGKLLAARRRTKRKTMGHRYRLPLGEQNHQRLMDARRRGHTYESMAKAFGTSVSLTWRLCSGGPETVVSARTWLTVRNTPLPNPRTQIGTTRRLQGLTWLGYSSKAIATEAGVHMDTIKDALREPRTLMSTRVMEAIADAYERLSMTPAAPEGSKQQRAGATRARNLARNNGWTPPLGWDEETIDDPTAKPVRTSPEAIKPSIDWAVVHRFLGGEHSLRTTQAERAAIVARWSRPLADLERMGWKPERYVDRGDVA